jgi:two-component system heavy metal sensor histidine kinase CusS
MLRPPSLALRLTLLFGTAAALIFPCFGWFINRSMEQHFEAEDIAELQVIVRAVEEALSGVHSQANLTSLEGRFRDLLVGHHRASMYLLGEDKRPIYAGPGPDLSTVAQSLDEKTDGNTLHRWKDAKHSYRVMIRRVGEGETTARQPYIIAIAVQIDYHLEFLEHFRRTLWLVVSGSIAIMTLMGWIAVRQGHAPLRDIVGQIRRISANELNTRLPPDSVPRELTDLAVSFNEMLERVDQAFHRLSDFNADIAHELRTPIANLMTQTQVALSRARSIDQYREILYSNMEEYERMAQMVGDMLFLAQAENSARNINGVDLDLAREVRTLFDYYEGWAEERGVSLALEGAARVPGDRLMLQRALGNLLSNAIWHTVTGGTVRVELGTALDGTVGIAVENTGADIPPEAIPKLFDRFYRVDPSRQRDGNGAGLGLAIVKSIVDAHGGNIDVVSAAGRTRFRITLPGPLTAAAPVQEMNTY